MAQLLPEELQSIKDLQSKYNTTVFEIGVIETQILTLTKQITKLRGDKEGLVSDLDTIEQQETDLIKSLQEKYGSGSINPINGEITPAQ